MCIALLVAVIQQFNNNYEFCGLGPSTKYRRLEPRTPILDSPSDLCLKTFERDAIQLEASSLFLKAARVPILVRPEISNHTEVHSSLTISDQIVLADEMPFEDEVLSSLLAHKVQVHAVEVSHGPLDPGTNLVHLTEISGGSHFTLTSFNIGAQFDTFLRNFILATKSPDFVAPSVFPVVTQILVHM